MKNIWTKELFLNNFLLIDKNKVYQEINAFHTMYANKIVLNKIYPIFKEIGGVNIEIGYIKIMPILINYFVDLFNQLSVDKKHNFFSVEQNFEILSKIIQKFHLEDANYSCCEGYILNYELINIVEIEGVTEIILKYKDSLVNTYILYKLAIINKNQDYFLVLQRIF
ncbi:MAG: hypothetical protein ACRCTJ_07025 [Brevinema sp.]